MKIRDNKRNLLEGAVLRLLDQGISYQKAAALGHVDAEWVKTLANHKLQCFQKEQNDDYKRFF